MVPAYGQDGLDVGLAVSTRWDCDRGSTWVRWWWGGGGGYRWWIRGLGWWVSVARSGQPRGLAVAREGERGEFPVTQRQIATSLFTAALAISDSEYFLHTARCSCSLIIGYSHKNAFDTNLNVSLFILWFSHAIHVEP